MKRFTMLLSILAMAYSLPSLADNCRDNPTAPGCTPPTNLPEPGALSLLGIGAGAALLALRRRKK